MPDTTPARIPTVCAAKHPPPAGPEGADLAGSLSVWSRGAKPGQLVDRETGSRWSTRSGRCQEGELEGKQLEVLPAIVSFRRAWEEFHPQSRYPAKKAE